MLTCPRSMDYSRFLRFRRRKVSISVMEWNVAKVSTPAFLLLAFCCSSDRLVIQSLDTCARVINSTFPKRGCGP